MCFGVSFHKQRIVPLTSAFEDSVHQLSWNSCPMETVCLAVMTEDVKRGAVVASRLLSTPN